MQKFSLNTAALALACLAGLGGVGIASAQAADKFPDRPIMFTVPFPPGGPTDAMARILATELTRELGQSVVVENRAGAGGNIGAEYVARAKPDGYTIMFGTSGPLAINKSLYKSISYDPRTSYAPIIYVGLPAQYPGGEGQPASRQRAGPDRAGQGPARQAQFRVIGNGASSHLAGVMFNNLAGTKLQHIPYKGTGPALNDLLAGQVDMSFTDILTAMPYIKAGKVKPLGVATRAAPAPCPTFPPWPSRAWPGMTWVFSSVSSPQGHAAERVQVLNQAFSKALDSDSVKKAFAAQGLEASPDRSPPIWGALSVLK
ncbi:Bug family tripartite tricarboxylate transporter substrate binding protein [Comamonas sp. JC664]|uniref:Bug family tripartite tricarboxylate transporter substrate binding protein n=1 Tax=Comamonas sp. JC664 TaxID=2801917 RepID=UPI003614998F